MLKKFKKIHKDAMELALYVSEKNYEGFKEEDLNTLAEAIDILQDLYETLYDEVFEKVEE